MSELRDILRTLEEDYSNIDAVNKALADYAERTGTKPLTLVPHQNEITEEEAAAQHPDLEDMTKVNGVALLHMGIGKPDKITIKDGKSLNGGVGDTQAYVIMGKVWYHFTQDYITGVYKVEE